MTWSTPPTFTTATTATAADVQVLSDDLTYLKAAADGVAFSGCQLTRSATQSIPVSTYTQVSWDTETTDVGGWHSSGANITVPSGAVPAGYSTIMVLVTVAVSWAVGDYTRWLRVLVNGTSKALVVQSAVSGETMGQAITTFVPVASGDIITVEVKQSTAGALDVTGAVSCVRYAPLA